jgi:predicted transposase YbfD/YdcC
VNEDITLVVYLIMLNFCLVEAIRGHWGIEHQLNWVLDIQFQEDDSIIRKDNAPENFAVIRQNAK